MLREAAFVRAWRPHVIHAHNARATVVAATAGRLGRGPRRPPVLATAHSAAERDRKASAALLTRFADEVVSVSEDLLVEFEGRNAQPTVIHNGVAPPPPFDAATRAALEAELGLDAARPVVAFVGRLAPTKNPRRFVEAAALVPEARTSSSSATDRCAASSRRSRTGTCSSPAPVPTRAT